MSRDSWLADLLAYLSARQQRGRQRLQASGVIFADLWWRGYLEAWSELAEWLVQHPPQAGAGTNPQDRSERALLLRLTARVLDQAVAVEGAVEVRSVQEVARALAAWADLELSQPERQEEEEEEDACGGSGGFPGGCSPSGRRGPAGSRW